MEDINAYLALTVNHGYGGGDSDGFGFSNGLGFSFNNSIGGGFTDGSGYGKGAGIGCSYNCGAGSGCICDENAYDYNDHDGDGYGYGNDSGIKNFCCNEIYEIDHVQTIIKKVRGIYAKGFILREDLTLVPCYIVKYDNYFAHGKTLKKAREAAFTKAMNDMSVEDRIAAFWKCHNRTDYYPVSDFFEWHSRLTGSCEMGRREFAKNHEIDIENGKMTVEEFINLTENAYGGEIIKKLRECALGRC